MASRPASEAARIRRNVVGDGFNLFSGVGGGDGKAALAHDRQVDDVVADIGELVDGVAGFAEDFFDGVHLVRLALIDELELEIVGANSHGLGLRLVMMPMRRPPRRPREMPSPSWAAKPLASTPWPSAFGITKIWPSVSTPSTSKMRILMFFARASAVMCR